MCACHSLSTAERGRIKSRLSPGAAAALRLHSEAAAPLCAARRPRAPADPRYSADRRTVIGSGSAPARAPRPRAPGNPRPPPRPASVHLSAPRARVCLVAAPGPSIWAAGLSPCAAARACVANQSPARSSSAQRARQGHWAGGGGSPGASRGDPWGALLHLRWSGVRFRGGWRVVDKILQPSFLPGNCHHKIKF